MELQKLLYNTHQNTIKKLNNLYISTDLIVPIIEKEYYLLKGSNDKEFFFHVPSTSKKKNRTIRRKKEDHINFLFETFNKEMFKNSVVTSITMVEDFLNVISKTIFLNYPNKLTQNVNGVNSVINVGVKDIVSLGTREEIILNIIEEKIVNLFYAAPDKIFDYFQQVFQVELPNEVKDSYKEIKASRDLLIHSDGIVNQIYLLKSGMKARAVIGETIPINQEYFEHVIKTCKQLIGQVKRQCIKNYCKTE